MLQSLSVKNFILIDELELELEPGLCVITGETGAGKSILLDAILFCLGEKPIGEVIKSGAEYCSVTAVFSLGPDLKGFLEQLHIEFSSELVIKRTQNISGRSKFLINDQIVTAKTLSQLTESLFELHGQNNHTMLLESAAHLDILDNYGNLLGLRKGVEEAFRHWQNIKRKIVEIEKEKAEVEREADYLSFVVNELTGADVKEGEEEALASTRHNLQNRDKEIQLYQDLFEEISAGELDQALNKATRLIARSGKDSEDLTYISKHLDECYNALEEARSRIKLLVSSFDEESASLEDVEERLFAIKALGRKYGVSADNLPNFLEESAEKLRIALSKISSVGELQISLEHATSEYFTRAQILSQKRKEIIATFEKKVASELSYLKMEKAVFKVEISQKNEEDASGSGTDQVRFIASTNPGMPAAPIDKVASGGELSRFMLALRVALFDKATRPTIIFDEIDTGIGGAVADSVGDRLKALSNAVQVLVITHQPQVAGKASQHILVSKTQLLNQTTVTIHTLSPDERSTELARMISGKSITESGLKAAKELLA